MSITELYFRLIAQSADDPTLPAKVDAIIHETVGAAVGAVDSTPSDDLTTPEVLVAQIVVEATKRLAGPRAHHFDENLRKYRNTYGIV